MTAPTLSSSERRQLRNVGQTLAVTVHVGRDGVSDTMLKALNDQLDRDELVKLRANRDDRQERAAIFSTLAERTGSALAGSVGRTALFYRPKPASG